MTTSTLFDNRSDFFKSYFEKAAPYEDFVNSGTPREQEKWRTIEDKVLLTPQQSELLSTFSRELNVLVLAGLWCGDCARQCPMLRAIEKASPTTQMRYLDNQAYSALRDELRISGGTRVPVVVMLSEDFFEMGRFGDRHLSVYRKKAARELGPSCDAGILPPLETDLAAELAEWVAYIERIHLMLRLSSALRQRHGD